jgi:hypothetical protein
MAENPTSKETGTPPAEEIQKMLGQAVLTGLVALLLLTCSFIYFIGKQKSELGDLLVQMSPQSKDAQNIDTFFNNFIYDLTAYSQQHPDVLQILVQSGFDVQQQQQQGGGAKRDMPPMPAPPPGQ